MPEEKEENIIKELEKEKIESFRIIDEFNGGLPYHQHTGLDGSPKLDSVNIRNKEIGGKYKLQIVKTGSFETSSVTYANVTDLVITFTLEDKERRFLLLANGSDIYHSTAGEIIYLTFSVDGSNVGDLVAYTSSGFPPRVPFSMSYITDNLSAGSHTFRVQMKISDGTGYLGTAGRTIFSIIELIN